MDTIYLAHNFTNKKKGEKVKTTFPTEESIFDFLNMVYKNPRERIDGRAALLKTPLLISEETSKKELKKKIRIKKHKKVVIVSELSEDEIKNTTSYIKGSVADMRSLLRDVDNNIPKNEEFFKKIEDERIRDRCNFKKVCDL